MINVLLIFNKIQSKMLGQLFERDFTTENSFNIKNRSTYFQLSLWHYKVFFCQANLKFSDEGFGILLLDHYFCQKVGFSNRAEVLRNLFSCFFITAIIKQTKWQYRADERVVPWSSTSWCWYLLHKISFIICQIF
jgi:hypothetical protein